MLEFSFNIEPDTNGIFDGRDLARSLVQTAYALLTPYVNACPACTDALFTAVANSAIEELQESEKGIPGQIMRSDADKDGWGWHRHLADTDALTSELLGLDDNPHHIH